MSGKDKHLPENDLIITRITDMLDKMGHTTYRPNKALAKVLDTLFILHGE
jgi:hypothetical protein